MSSNYWLDVDGNWTNTANWSTGSVPVTGDTVYILAGVQAIATNLNQSAVTLANMIVGQGFTGSIGTSSAYLQISATLWTVGSPQGSATAAVGSSRIKIDFGSVQYAGTVINTNNGTADVGMEPVRIKGSHASNKLTMLAGRVGVGTTAPTETATVLEIDVAGGVANFGYGVTWTTANVSQGATFFSQSGGGTTLTTSAGATATINGSAKITDVNAGGTTYLNMRPGSGNVVDTLNVYPAGAADFTQNPGSGTLGTTNLYKGGKLNTSAGNPNHITGTITRMNGGSLSLN